MYKPLLFNKKSDGRVDRVEWIPIIIPLGTVATTGNTGTNLVMPLDGILEAVYFSGTTTLAANDTNYVTFSILNKSNSDAALLVTDALTTTQVTGGTAFTAFTPRALTVTTTVADRRVKQYEDLLVRVAATGTLANVIAESSITLLFSQVAVLGR